MPSRNELKIPKYENLKDVSCACLFSATEKTTQFIINCNNRMLLFRLHNVLIDISFFLPI